MKQKILYTFLILSLAILFAEILLRVIQPNAIHFYWVQKSYHKYDPDYLVDLEPNVNVHLKHFLDFFSMKFTTNEYGFRATQKIDNQKSQIACIGDSITMGFGVDDEDTFCYKLDNYKDSNNTTYQAINLGVDAYGPGAISLKLKKTLPKLNVKLLYYFASPGDDIDEVEFRAKKTDPAKQKAFQYQFQATKYSYLLMGLKITSEQMQYRFNETFVWPYNKMLKTLNCIKSSQPFSSCGDVYFQWDRYTFFREFLASRPTPLKVLQTKPVELPPEECIDSPKGFNIPDFMLQSIQSIIDTSKQHNAKLVVVLTPIDFETAYCAQKGKFHRYYEYLNALKAVLEKNNISYFDMLEYTPEMVDETGQKNVRPYYIYGDGHYTKLGHNWIYKKLIQKTKEVLP